MKRRWMVLVSLGVLVVNLSGCERGGSCTMMSCSSGVRMDVVLPQATWSLIRTWSMTVCRNAVCASGSMADLPATNPNGGGYGFPVVGAAAPDQILASVGLNGGLTVYWNSDSIHDGDRYTLKVTNSVGDTIASLDRVATYTKNAPNGEECGPVCREATLN